MLTESQIDKLVKSVEEEVREMSEYKNLLLSKVNDVIRVDGFVVNIEVISEEDMIIYDDGDEE